MARRSVYLHYRDPGHYADIRRENPRAVQFLQSDESLFRVLPLPNFRVLEEPGYHLYGVWSITGFHDLTVGRYDRMLKEFEPLVQQFLRSGAPSAGFQSLLNLLNGKYLAVPKPIELDMAAYPLRFDGRAIGCTKIRRRCRGFTWCRKRRCWTAVRPCWRGC